ncbi:MAG: glycosyltransferase [bacterium]
MSDKVKRVLQVVPSMGFGGISTMLMSIYRNLDTSRVQFDFVAFIEGEYSAEVTNRGGKVFYFKLMKKQGLPAYMSSLRAVIAQHGPYEAIHAHRAYHDGFTLWAAHQAGINRRIAHIHTSNLEMKSRRILLPFLNWLLLRNATIRLACSHDAGVFSYGRHQFEVLSNAIDAERYRIAATRDRSLLRHELGAGKDMLVIGHVGRFSPVKNHDFALEVASRLHADGVKFKLVLAGDGPLRSEMEQKASKLSLDSCVAFLGLRSDIPDVMHALDVLILPSHFEGLPLTVLEAQAMGTPCLMSVGVPRAADIGIGLAHFMDLKDGAVAWAIKLKEISGNGKRDSIVALQALSGAGYDLQKNIKRLLDLYGIN